MPTDLKSETPAAQPAGNQPGGPRGGGIEFENGSRGGKSAMNLDETRAIGAPETPVDPVAAGQLPDSAGDNRQPSKADKPKAGA